MNTWKKVCEIKSNIPVTVPDGKSGEWAVETFEVSKEDEKFGIMRSIFSSERGRYVTAGIYKRLTRNGEVIMSNTPDEIRDAYEFFSIAKGNILINGLGLGIVLKAILKKINDDGTFAVQKVIVVEKSKDVIQLVAPSFKDDVRVEIINDDAMTYQPPKGMRFDAIWHDIWDNICSDNLKEMKFLHRKYGRKTDWQGSWCRERCEK